MTKTISEVVKILSDIAEKSGLALMLSDVDIDLVDKELRIKGSKQALKDFVSELKENSHKVGNERVVTENTIERILIKYTK